MITFITKKVHQVTEEPDVLKIREQFTHEDLTFIKSLSNLGLDLETNDLDPYTGSILLLIIGNKEHQYVIDAVSIDCEQILLDIIEGDITTNTHRELTKVVLGANLKFDYKFIKIKWGIELVKMFDVMIAEQRLYQGQLATKQNPNGVSASLAAITQRRLKVIRNKDVRGEFIGVNPNTFIFKNTHIQYGAEDVSYLPEIVASQKIDIAAHNQSLLIYGIEFPLIRDIADCELEGWNINEEKWRDNIKKNKKNKFKSECKLDEELKALKINLLSEEDRTFLSNGKFDRVRQKTIEIPTLEENNLFGDLLNEIEVNPLGKPKKKTKTKSAYINYGSTDEILTILGRLGQPAPTSIGNKQPGPYVVPKFIKVKSRGKGGTYSWKIDKSEHKFTTGGKTIENYLVENPNVPIKAFIKELIDLRKYNTRLNTFGEEFLKKYKNKVTGLFHTVYRQCVAVTSRFQSGDKKNNVYNSQNIPKENDYRHCFYRGDEYIITSDLSGAEAVIMIDKAHDEKFYQLAIVNDDAHSPLAQAVWRAIGNYRMENAQSEEAYEEAVKLSNIVISKKINKDIRTAYKNNTFGDIYGQGIAKRAKTLGVNSEESKIAGKTQKSMIPKTYAMVEAAERFALTNGYIIINERTNSKCWYLSVLEAKRNHSALTSSAEYQVKNSARNMKIQGTQADMIKEMIVEIGREARKQGFIKRFSFALLGQVHDEIIYKSNDVTTLVEFTPDGENAEIELVTIPQFINKMMCKVGNRYLSFIKITAETTVEKTWNK